MRTNIFKAGVAMSLCIATLATSCSDKIAEDHAPLKEQIPLEVTVAGIHETRSIITGTTLPDTCDFSIFFNSEYPTAVRYEKGSCKLQQPIYLDENSVTAPVYAFYPGNAYLTEIAINTNEQKDYLRGISTDSVDASNPKARIIFDHILSRITLNIHKDAEVPDSYKFPEVFLGGDSENSYRSAVFNAKTNSFIYYSTDGFDNIRGEFKDGKYWLETPEDVITVDFLVLPSETTWWLYIKDLPIGWYSLPATKYDAGKQYIYDCLLKGNDKFYLTISECDIQPWESTQMPGVEGY